MLNLMCEDEADIVSFAEALDDALLSNLNKSGVLFVGEDANDGRSL